MALGYHAQVIFHGNSGLPTDTYVNDFDFVADGTPDASDFNDLVQALSAFYNGPATPVVGEFMSAIIDRTAELNSDIKIYEVPDTPGPLGTPVWEQGFGLTPPDGSTILPAEVSGVLSYNADLTGIPEKEVIDPGPPVVFIRPRARRRGRVYIGPLTDAAVEFSDGNVFLTEAFLAVIGDAGIELAGTTAHGIWTWCVWSRADWAMREVVGGFVENAPDTQRRRGPDATLRAPWFSA